MTVPLRPRDGAVLVGYRPAAPAGTGLVLLAGMDVHVDPTAPDSSPFAVVHDVAEAEAALVALYGRELATAVADADADGTARTVDVGSGLVPAAVSPAAAAVRRLGLARWLDTNSPDQLDNVLLDLEVGTACAALTDLLAEPEADDGNRRLLGRAAATVRLAQSGRESVAGLTAPLDALISEALPALRLLLPADSTAFDDILHEIDMAAAAVRLGREAVLLDWEALVLLPGTGSRELEPAGSRGGPSARGPGSAGTDSVDWCQVPRGVLSSGEGTVSWVISDGAVEVTVAAAAAGPTSTGLAFRLYAAGSPLPLAVGRLVRRTDDVYRGRAVVHGAPEGELTLDVHDPTARRPPVLGIDRVGARAARWATRAVTALRLGGNATAAECLDQAFFLFEQVAAEHPANAERTRAIRRAARCQTLEVAVRSRLGEAFAALDAEPPLAATDVEIPELAGRGWQPLAVEAALGVTTTGG